MASNTTTPAADVLPLRDRQRAAVRAELRLAAYRLFIEHGYEAVSVDDIAAAAGLSRRTVFRHVAGKEDILLGEVRQGGAAIAHTLENQPGRLGPDKALKNAIVARAATFDESEMQTWRAAFLSAAELQDKITLVSAADRRRIENIIAARMGTDPDTDPRPGLLVQLAFAAADYGFQRWVRQSTDPRTLGQWIEQCLQSVIHHQWRAPAPR